MLVAKISRTRRAHSSTAEQQNRLAEQSGSETRRVEGPAPALHEGEQGVDGTLAGNDGSAGWRGLARRADEAPEADEQSMGRCLR